MLADLCVQRKQAESEFHEKAEALYCIREEKWADLVQVVQVVQIGRCKLESFQLKKRVLLCLIPQQLQCRCMSEGVIELETGMYANGGCHKINIQRLSSKKPFTEQYSEEDFKSNGSGRVVSGQL